MIVERNISGQRLLAECAPPYAAMAASVLDVFERHASAEHPLAEGTQIRFGWSLLRLLPEATALRIAEPDFTRWPALHWSNAIDITLKTLAEQTRLLHKLGASGEDVFLEQRIVVAADALEQRRIFLRRDAGSAAENSGWLLGSVDDPEALGRDDIEGVEIATLVARRPAVLQVLTLPAGFMALFAGNALEQVFDAAGTARLRRRNDPR
jgi:hypothetical protein